MKKGKLVLSALAAALVAVCVAWPATASTRPTAAAANSAGFSDPAGDSGNAPDITTVDVSNDDAGVITFRIAIPNRSSLGVQDFLLMLLETDGDASNGAHGFDYGIAVTPIGPMLLSGASGSMARGSSSSLSGSFSGGVETLTINRSDIGNPGTVQFYVTATGDSATTFGDDAPDGSAVWQYQIIVSAAPPPPPATPPAPAPAPPPSPPSPPPASPLTLAATKLTVGKATAGKPLSVTMAVSRSDTGSGLSGGRVACSAWIGASALRATKSGPTGGVATCHWLVPKTARGRAIRGSITVTYHGATATRTFSARIR